MSIEILASKLTGIYHTQFSVAYFLVSPLLSKMFDVGDRDLPVPTSSNWVIIGSWLSGYVFYVFWKSKKH